MLARHSEEKKSRHWRSGCRGSGWRSQESHTGRPNKEGTMQTPLEKTGGEMCRGNQLPRWEPRLKTAEKKQPEAD
ncbi:hypothetical protein NDU88_007440 [Pleurodeles waltl]|uniref:Uncharacterized protein n=1 Tax=Pleurodeles waltl TaxID=8319 RepID=A0AAV7PPC6_PLEWA|nr:hypothetical protein NDU88_007440 [Pleurodeles waltl]